MKPKHDEHPTMNQFHTEIAKTFKEAVGNEVTALTLRNMQMKDHLDAIAKHQERWGHLFFVDERTGEILKDSYGFPLPLPIIGTPKSSVDLITKILDALETVDKALRDQAPNEKPAINMDAYAYLLAPAKSAKRI